MWLLVVKNCQLNIFFNLVVPFLFEYKTNLLGNELFLVEKGIQFFK